MIFDGPTLAGIAAMLTAIGGIVAGLFRRKGKKEAEAVEGLRAVVDAQKALNESALEVARDASDRVDELADDLDELRDRHDELRREHDIDQAWISALREHIEQGFPPPPPERPTHLKRK